MTLESPLTSMLGRITDHWGIGNLLSLVQQIGGWIPRDTHQWKKNVLLIGISLAVAGCPKGRTEFNEGRKPKIGFFFNGSCQFVKSLALCPSPKKLPYHFCFAVMFFCGCWY